MLNINGWVKEVFIKIIEINKYFEKGMSSLIVVAFFFVMLNSFQHLSRQIPNHHMLRKWFGMTVCQVQNDRHALQFLHPSPKIAKGVRLEQRPVAISTPLNDRVKPTKPYPNPRNAVRRFESM